MAMATTSTADAAKAKKAKVERAVWMVSCLQSLDSIILALESSQFMSIFSIHHPSSHADMIIIARLLWAASQSRRP